MIKTFHSYGDLTSDLAFDLIERLKASTPELDAQFGRSNQSCSAYVNVTAWDDEGDEAGAFKVRFSDHDDRHGADLTIRIDRLCRAVEDDGEYLHIEIASEDYDAALEAALAKVVAFAARAAEEA